METLVTMNLKVKVTVQLVQHYLESQRIGRRVGPQNSEEQTKPLPSRLNSRSQCKFNSINTAMAKLEWTSSYFTIYYQ